MTRRELDILFKPRAVAVVGAGRDPGGFGHLLVKRLVDGGFQGPVYPVNPKARVIHSLPCHASPLDLPEPIDLSIIALPAKKAAEALEKSAEAGARAVLVISAGFRDSGPEGEELERQLVQAASKRGVRLLGPNCMGVINTDPAVSLNATFIRVSMQRGRMALVSQSGAMGAAILSYAEEMGLGLSTYASLGNGADVSVNDMLEYFRDDPDVDAVLLYIESFGDPKRFTAIARSMTPRKPIIAVKAGRTGATGLRRGGEGASEGGLGIEYGDDRAVDALFLQCGVMRVQSLEEMFDLASAVARGALPKGPRIAILTNGGGPGIMAQDAAEGLDLVVPPLDPRTVAGLERALPARATVRNPVDIRTDADPGLYGETARVILSDPNVDSLLGIYVGPESEKAAASLSAGVKGASKPAFACMMGGWGQEKRAGAASGSVPHYRFPESACRVIRRMYDYGVGRDLPRGKVKKYRAMDRDKVAVILNAAVQAGRESLRPEELRSIVEAYGAKPPQGGVVFNEEDAVKLANETGYPVVVKAASSGIRKKSDVGGVLLDVGGEDEVRRAYHAVQENVRARYPSAEVRGIIIQRMLKGGRELILGVDRDPIFGPVLKIGAGGPYADIIRDFQYRILPVTPLEARRMINDLKIFPLLEGTRGRRPVHVPSLVDLLCRAGQLISDFDAIMRFEVNPLIAFHGKKDFWAVDGSMTLFPSAELPGVGREGV